MGKILILVDCQYDFINGSLAVGGAADAMGRLVEYIKANANEYKHVILTCDWHPQTHISFKENGGEWPMHCVQHSVGAAIWQPVLDALNESKADYTVVIKGDNEDREEYSIFKNAASTMWISNIAKQYDANEVDVCGIALDYCVKDTIQDGIKVLDAKFKLLKDMSPAIGDAEAVYSYLDNIGVEVV